jgi:hypothetical protein
MPRQIDHREQEVAGFLLELVGTALIERGFDLVGLLANLAQQNLVRREHRAPGAGGRNYGLPKSRQMAFGPD